ncbi:MAG: hypothetical protein KA314_20685 [Chloroflexi bacterium]|nr:hypothetical protein [Chloroflexota bacterium]MBP8058255.1 hypothetical protein [Chloroflexota bacterium]
MTQKPPSRQPSAGKSTAKFKPVTSCSSSGRAAATSLPNLSPIKGPARRYSTGLLSIIGIIFFYLGGGCVILTGNGGDNNTTPRSPITPGAPRATATNIPFEQTGEDADWYYIYFTDADCPPEEERGEGLDSIIAETISLAEESVDIAVFELDSEPIVEALIGLEERGIPVRVVVDTDYIGEASIRRLRRNGISVIEDDRSAFMHNKFTVIDNRYVWVGSMNYMPNDIYCNNNNLVWFDSPELAANYTTEMDEMYNDGGFGPRSEVNTPAEQLDLYGVSVENYFAPETKVAPLLGELIRQAQNEILFMAFSFTHEDVGEAMLERADQGVVVQGVFETTGSEQDFSYYTIMSGENLASVEIRQDGNRRIMHHKVIILDRETVIFGSFNFTGSANDSNDENVVVVHDPTFASYFVDEFFRVWGEAE